VRRSSQGNQWRRTGNDEQPDGELQAAIAALRALKEPCRVTLFTDSVYVRSGITEWLPAWKAQGWRTVAKQPVKNADLWRPTRCRSQPSPGCVALAQGPQRPC